MSRAGASLGRATPRSRDLPFLPSFLQALHCVPLSSHHTPRYDATCAAEQVHLDGGDSPVEGGVLGCQLSSLAHRGLGDTQLSRTSANPESALSDSGLTWVSPPNLSYGVYPRGLSSPLPVYVGGEHPRTKSMDGFQTSSTGTMILQGRGTIDALSTTGVLPARYYPCPYS